MNKELKKKKAEKLRNKKLVKKYYFLKPSPWRKEKYDYSYIEWFGWPEGWNKAFGMMYLKELGDEVKRVGQKNFYILQQKEKYGCYDDKTEVLTKDGWKFFKDLSYEDEIATLNPHLGYLEYEYPTDIIVSHYKGKMYKLENRGISLCVTPNHNLYVAKGSNYRGTKGNFKKVLNDFELCNPEKYFGMDKRFKKNCKWEGQYPAPIYKIKGIEYDSPVSLSENNSKLRHYVYNELSFNIIPWLRFLGFYIAEGCVSNKKESKRHDDISVAFNPYDELELVQKLIYDIGFNPIINMERGSARFCNTTLGEWLLKNCGHMAYNKKVPAFIKRLPPEYIEEFLKYLFIGDGHKTQTANVLSTTSKQLSDDVQELLLKAGYSFRERIRDRRNRFGGYSKKDNHPIISKRISYEINWLQLPDIEIDMYKAKKNQKFQEEWIDYNGCVYCVTVPNHIIYVRRNGKGVWCGNSARNYTSGTFDSVHRIIDKYECISEGVCWNCGKPDVPMIDDGWVHPICHECFYQGMKTREKYRSSKEPYTDKQIDDIYHDCIIDNPDENGEYRISDTYQIKHWDKDGERIETYDISETVEAIRKRWKERQKNYANWISSR